MKGVTIAGESFWLLPHGPEGQVRLGLGFAVSSARSLGGAAVRSAGHELPRWSLEWSSQLDAVDYYALRAGFRAAQAERIAVPLWPLAWRIVGGVERTVGGHVVAWTEGWASWAVDPASLAGYDYAAPLLLGDLASPPELKAMADDRVTAGFSFDEDSDAADAVQIAAGVLPADTLFATASGYTAPVFPFAHDPAQEAMPGVARAEIERERVGAGRRKVRIYFPQIPEELQETGFAFASMAEAARLLAWWIRRAGAAGAHWVAGTQALARLSADAAAGATVLAVRDGHGLVAPGYLALMSPDAGPEFARITATTGTSVTLAAPLARAWGASATSIVAAMLATHTREELVLTCTPAGADWIASTSVAWREVAAEYTAPAGEVRGTTLGTRAPRAYFAQFDLDSAGALQTWRFTNWESGAEAGGHTWSGNSFTFDGIVRSLDLEDDSCTLSGLRYFAGGPWDNWLPGGLYARGFLTLYQADRVDGAFVNFRQLFRGELAEPDFELPLVRHKALGANALMGRSAPRQLMTRVCGTNLFRPRCGLALADWTFNATVATRVGTELTITGLARANGAALPAGFAAAHWFALGWLGWTEAAAPRRALVLASTALAAGAVTLTLDRALPLALGTAVTVVPGCDRLGATCREKFDNYGNFRGYENSPSVSPSFKIPNSTTTAAKK